MVGTYIQDKLQLIVVRGEKEQKMSIRIPEHVIDNESSLMMIRNFPLAEGYVKNVNLSVVGTGMVAPYRVTATNRESITVPYGTFECYKVVWQYTGRGSAPDITSWYSTDEARLLVQYTQQSVRFELAEYSTNREDKW